MKNFVDGQWIPARGDTRWISRSPADRSDTLGEFVEDPAAVEQAIDAAGRAQAAWEALGKKGRKKHLRAFQKELANRSDQLTRVIAREVGKPLWEARTEVRALGAKIDVTLDAGMELVEGATLKGSETWMDGGYRHRALGVCAVLGPFNFPVHLANGHIVPALACGNTCVFKPSEKAPECARLYMEAAEAAGFPDGVLNMVQGRREVGERLVKSRDVAAVLFTGSLQTGLAIRRATVEQPWKLVALEMGGKNTAIVMADADLDRAAYEIGVGALLTCGQRCTATSRVVVAESLIEPLIDRLERIWDRVKVGHPMDESTFMGPLIGEGAVDRFLDAARTARDEGMEPIRENSQAVVEGPDGPYDGCYVRPALWRATRRPNPEEDDHDTCEIFGPDVVLHTVPDADHDAMAELANATPFGLAMAVFTAEEETFEEMAARLRAGVLNFNRSTVGASGRLPFGGVKNSGNHRPAALLSPLYCTYPVSTLRQTQRLDPREQMSRFPDFVNE